VKNELIVVIFGAQNAEETSHQMIINVFTSRVICSHCTLWKEDNVHLIEASTITYVRCNRLFSVRNIVNCRPKSCNHNINSTRSCQLSA